MTAPASKIPNLVPPCFCTCQKTMTISLSQIPKQPFAVAIKHIDLKLNQTEIKVEVNSKPRRVGSHPYA